MADVEQVLKQRQEVLYGGFGAHSVISQGFKVMMHGTPQWYNLTDAQQEALEMIAHKIARILNGDPNYIDNWVDIAGYAQLVVDILEETPHAIKTEVIYTAVRR